MLFIIPFKEFTIYQIGEGKTSPNYFDIELTMNVFFRNDAPSSVLLLLHPVGCIRTSTSPYRSIPVIRRPSQLSASASRVAENESYDGIFNRVSDCGTFLADYVKAEWFICDSSLDY